jgi:hypothetical protein
VLKAVEKWGWEVNGKGKVMEEIKKIKAYPQRAYIETPL